jgi:ribosome-binding factor A
MPREFQRTERVGDLLQRELALLLETEVRDRGLGLVTVSGAEVSRDLAYARVHVSVLNSPRDIASVIKMLNEAAGHLRHRLSQRLRLRSVPRLRFVYDASIAQGAKLSELIDAAVAADESKHKETHG